MSSSGRRARGALWGLFYKALIPFRRLLSSWLKHLPKAPPPNTILLGVRISAYECWGDTTVQGPVSFVFYNSLFICFWLCWVFISVRGLSPVVASGGHSSSRCAGLSLSRPLLLRSTSSRRAGSVVVAHGPSCSAACGIFLDQGSNPRSLHWQADSQPLRHQGSPRFRLLIGVLCLPALS